MSKYPKTSVIDIAMGILENMDAKKDIIQESSNFSTSIPVKDPNVSDFVPDVTDTQVTEEFIDYLLEGTMNIPVQKVPKQQKIKEVKKQQPSTNITEQKLTDLVDRLSKLLAEARQVLNEATTAGMLSVNLSGKNKEQEKPPVRNLLRRKRK